MNQRSTYSPSARRTRRGVTILIVLVLISLTLAFSFAMMRTQTASSQVQQNYQRRVAARQAAMAGISIGMRKMSQASWEGVGVDITGSLGNGVSYNVTFTTGDPRLTAGHPDEAEYPYCVTVASTGTSTAPSDPNQQSSHTIRTVMRLVRQHMQPPPESWSQVQAYTLYQWNSAPGKAVEIEIPSRIEGPVAIQNAIKLCEHYPEAGAQETFAGVIDHVTIFGTDFTADVIEDLRDGGVTLNGLLGDLQNAPVGSWQFEESAGATIARDELNLHPGLYEGATSGAHSDSGSRTATFDGLNDQVYLGEVGVDTGRITILTRLKIDAFHDKMRIVSSSTSSVTDWALSIEGIQRRLKFTVRLTSDKKTVLRSKSKVLSLGKWIDVAAVYDGDHLTLYLDGEKVGEIQRNGHLASTHAATTSIGCRSPGSARARYLRDLGAMAQAGEPDHRPFDGPLSINRSMVSAVTQSLLEEELGLEINELTLPSGPPVPHPGHVSHYQLYPGGKVYSVQYLAGSISDKHYGPNPLTNPLGLFVCTHQLRIHNNVTISGTILSFRDSIDGEIRIVGNNISLNAVNLPPLVGATEPLQLPVAIISDDFEIDNNSSGSVNGLTLSWDDFHFHGTNRSTQFELTGKILTSEIVLDGLDTWDNGASWWKDHLREFMNGIDLLFPADSRFPNWLADTHDLNSMPLFHVRPPTDSVQYHWHDWSKPLFIPDPTEDGLRWDLTEWRDNP